MPSMRVTPSRTQCPAGLLVPLASQSLREEVRRVTCGREGTDENGPPASRRPQPAVDAESGIPRTRTSETFPAKVFARASSSALYKGPGASSTRRAQAATREQD